MREKILEIKNLTFSYEEGKKALDRVSADIFRKEKIAVLGANGSGKSTFFLCLNGVRRPEEGEIHLFGERIGSKAGKKLLKSVGIVFQEADSQIIASTVKAEIAFGPLNLGLKKEETKKRTKEAMEKLKLEEYQDRPPHYLSGGEKKRVCIADILAMKTDVIIFDEPTASLDPHNVRLLEHILGELEEEGKTLLVSTHDVDFAYRFAARVLVFSEGRLLADGKTEDVFNRRETLEKACLSRPVLMQVYDLLKDKHMAPSTEKYPKTVAELEELLK